MRYVHRKKPQESLNSSVKQGIGTRGFFYVKVYCLKNINQNGSCTGKKCSL